MCTGLATAPVLFAHGVVTAAKATPGNYVNAKASIEMYCQVELSHPLSHYYYKTCSPSESSSFAMASSADGGMGGGMLGGCGGGTVGSGTAGGAAAGRGFAGMPGALGTAACDRLSTSFSAHSIQGSYSTKQHSRGASQTFRQAIDHQYKNEMRILQNHYFLYGTARNVR